MLIYREIFNIDLPSYDEQYQTAENFNNDVSDLLTSESENWEKINLGDEGHGDLILLRINGLPWHVSVVLDKNYMLNINRETASCIERYNSKKWERRILGFYRYVHP